MKAVDENVAQYWEAFHRTGSVAAKDRLLIHYVTLVHHLAGRLKVTLPASVQVDDLTSCGILGLIRAIENFDPARGFKFETYAVPVVRGAMLDGLREYDWLPRTQRVKNRRIEVAIRELERRLGRSPEDEEIATELGLTEEQFQQLLSEAGAGVLVSLDNEVSSSDNSSGSFHEVISDESADTPLEALELSEVRSIARKLLVELPEQHRKVMALYYFEELTLKEIGVILHITESGSVKFTVE
ncbi:MAG: FliA/WhiG family RNA polymerase sigma factor [bacterium]|nr:FliA/WhiG family RNA polymerase sigma factor [bacterium]